MISAVALGDMDDMFIGLLPTVLAAIDVKAGALEMGNGGRSPEALGRGGGNERVEFRHAIVVEGLQGAPQRIIIEVRGVNAGANEPLSRLVLKKHGDEVELLVHKPQPIEHHRFDGMAKSHDPLLRVSLSCSINHITTTKFVEHPSDEAEMIENLTAG
jgi:hypothetical protein